MLDHEGALQRERQPLHQAPGFVAEAFLASRIAGDQGRAFGTLPPGVDTTAIVGRADPLAA